MPVPAPQHAGLPVHFPFLEGQLGYRCHRCDARCCHQVGTLYLGQGQLELLEELGLEHAAVSGTSATVDVELGYGGCPALGSEGRCALHDRHGRLGKPALCALFPFSRLIQLEELLVVAPALSFICPIELEPPEDALAPRHDEILGDLQHFFGDSAAAFSWVQEPEHTPVRLADEQRLRSACNDAAPEDDLGALLARVWRLDPTALEDWLQRCASLMQLEPDELPAELRARMLPLLPNLRTYFYDLDPEASARALLLGTRWIARTHARAQLPPGPRWLASQLLNLRPLLRLLAHADRPLVLQGEARVRAVPDPAAAQEARGLLRRVVREPGRWTLESLLAEAGQSQGHQRRLVLHALARELEG